MLVNKETYQAIKSGEQTEMHLCSKERKCIESLAGFAIVLEAPGEEPLPVLLERLERKGGDKHYPVNLRVHVSLEVAEEIRLHPYSQVAESECPPGALVVDMQQKTNKRRWSQRFAPIRKFRCQLCKGDFSTEITNIGLAAMQKHLAVHERPVAIIRSR